MGRAIGVRGCITDLVFSLAFVLAGCSSSDTGGSQSVPEASVLPLPEAGLFDRGLFEAPETPLTLAHVPEGPCVESGGIRNYVYLPSAKAPGFELLGKVGARRVATAFQQAGFALMDVDGTNASPALIAAGDINRAAGGPTSVALAALTAHAVTFTRYDASGNVLAPTAELAQDAAYDVFIGRSEEKTLVVWSARSRLRAVAVDPNGVVGTAFDLETDLRDKVAVSIAPGLGADFLIVWSKRRASDTQYRLLSSRGGAAGQVGLAQKLAGQLQSIRVVQVVHVGVGYALLVDVDNVPAVVPLDSYGRLAGPAQVLDGTVQGFGLASHQGALGVVALRKDSRPAFRPLDASGVPIGPWVCLDAGKMGMEPSMSIDNDANGYSVLFRMADGTIAITRFDRVGTGNQ